MWMTMKTKMRTKTPVWKSILSKKTLQRIRFLRLLACVKEATFITLVMVENFVVLGKPGMILSQRLSSTIVRNYVKREDWKDLDFVSNTSLKILLRLLDNANSSPSEFFVVVDAESMYRHKNKQ